MEKALRNVVAVRSAIAMAACATPIWQYQAGSVDIAPLSRYADNPPYRS